MSNDQQVGHPAPGDPTTRYRAYGAPGSTEAVWTASTIALLDELLGFDEILTPYPDESAFAPTRRHEGVCRTCAKRLDLSFEHFPPKTMGNKTKVRRAPASAAINSENPLEFPRAASFQVQRGSGANVLCGDCNSHLGINYVPTLTMFARVVTGQVQNHIATTGTAPGILALSLDGWELGDIARAGLASVMAQGVHDRLLRLYPKLSEIVLRGATALPDGLRLGLTLALRGRVRVSPPHANSSPRGECVFMEMSAPPFAWTLSFMGEGRVALDRTADVSHWLDVPPGVQSDSATLALPVGAVDSPLSGDFRPRPVIEAQMVAHAPS